MKIFIIIALILTVANILFLILCALQLSSKIDKELDDEPINSQQKNSETKNNDKL